MSTLDYSNPLIYCQPEALFALKPFGQKLQLGKPRASQALMAGNVRTRYKGRGMSFAEVRPYQAGDDIRCIDWRVTARTGKTHTKVYREERERPVLLWVDYRKPMFFGTRNSFKSVVAAKTAALLAWSTAQHGDRLGGLDGGKR